MPQGGGSVNRPWLKKVEAEALAPTPTLETAHRADVFDPTPSAQISRSSTAASTPEAA